MSSEARLVGVGTRNLLWSPNPVPIILGIYN